MQLLSTETASHQMSFVCVFRFKSLTPWNIFVLDKQIFTQFINFFVNYRSL